MKILIDLLTIKKRIHFTTRGAVVEADGSAHFVHDMKLQCGNPFPASVGALAVATRLICVAQFSLQEEHVLDALRHLQCPLLIVLGTKGWYVSHQQYHYFLYVINASLS